MAAHRPAEEFLLEHCEAIIGFPKGEVLDSRIEAQGFDFGVRSDPRLAIEVKGMRAAKGQLLFTDREWTVGRAVSGLMRLWGARSLGVAA